MNEVNAPNVALRGVSNVYVKPKKRMQKQRVCVNLKKLQNVMLHVTYEERRINSKEYL
jgi:hypothetical protein